MKELFSEIKSCGRSHSLLHGTTLTFLQSQLGLFNTYLWGPRDDLKYPKTCDPLRLAGDMSHLEESHQDITYLRYNIVHTPITELNISMYTILLWTDFD